MSSASDSSVITTQCCIVGGGPAGMILGYLLARAGVRVTVLEKHADFLRDFRGDTVHPSTLQILKEVGLLAKFNQLNPQRVPHIGVSLGGRTQPIVDFRGLKPFDYLALIPQWDFLDLLATEGKRFPTFDLRMCHEATQLLKKDERVIGVCAQSPEGPVEIHTDLVVACDGRHSTLRAAATMQVQDLGAPMDVLWFRLPRHADAPDDTFGIVDVGQMMVLLNRKDYWQAAYVIAKGGDQKLRAQPLNTLRAAVTKLAPFLSSSIDELKSWEQVKTLEVHVDRLTQWHRPGLLLIGDAAHAMSPIGGVGINLAIQDAIAAANVLAPVFAASKKTTLIEEALLAKIQQRRLPAVKLIQAMQIQIQKRVISKVLKSSGDSLQLPTLLKWLLKFRVVRNIPARLVGYGYHQEHVRTSEHSA